MTGEYIRTKIITSGYQQVEVAQKLGISPQSLENRLKAKDVKVSFLLEVAKAINKTIYYFFSDFLDENFLKKDQNDSSSSYVNEKDVKASTDDYILLKIAEVLSAHLSPNFEVSQKSLNVVTESQSRILLNQGELLDKVEELLAIYKKEKDLG